MPISRRAFLKTSAAAAGVSLLPGLAVADEQLITRPFPGGRRVPVVGIGTSRRWDFGPAGMAPARETLAKFLELGGTVLDTAPSYQRAEDVIGALLTELDVREGVFLSTKVRKHSAVAARSEMEASFQRMQTDFIELCSVHNFVGIDEVFPIVREWRDAGRYRYIGVTTHRSSQHPDMVRALNILPLDSIQVNYSLLSRDADRKVLPLALDKGVAVTVNVPYARGDLFQKVGGRELPDWAAEFDCRSWGQFFLKYIIGHPAVTVVIPGTSKVHHLEDNMGAAYGRLPDQVMRKRMEEFIDSL